MKQIYRNYVLPLVFALLQVLNIRSSNLKY